MVTPHPDDPAPSPLLGNIPGALRHATRVRRPAVRRGWLEHGPGPSDRRGHDPFCEVSWDKALDLVAAELARVRGAHGNEAIFGGSYGWASAGRFHHAQSQLHRFLALGGGYVASRNTYSLGTSEVLLPHLVGSAGLVLRGASSWPTIVANTELIVAFGGIPEKNVYVTPGGMTTHGTPGLPRGARGQGNQDRADQPAALRPARLPGRRVAPGDPGHRRRADARARAHAGRRGPARQGVPRHLHGRLRHVRAVPVRRGRRRGKGRRMGRVGVWRRARGDKGPRAADGFGAHPGHGHLVAAAHPVRRAAGLGRAGAGRDAWPDRPARRRVRPRLRLHGRHRQPRPAG